MTTAEKWNRIVDYYNKYLGAAEQTVQNVWENIFAEFLGYSRLEDEIERHRKIYIGSTERVITDIIIKNGNTDLFVVELKQHNLPLNKGMEMQLLSYLKQLRNSTGILICNKIYIYDYDNNKSDDEQDRAEIEFNQDNPNGIRFIEMFNKSSFNKTNIKEFVCEQNEFVNNVGFIEKELQTDLVITLLRDYFTAKYSEAEFEQAINGFNITITPKNAVHGNLTLPSVSYSKPVSREDNTLTKKEAVSLCNDNDVPVGGNCTLAKRSSGRTFAANPSFRCLSQDWWIMLNDYLKNELHIFKVPANSLSSNELKIRKDKPELFNVQIRCDDNTFEDTQSKIRFATWFVKTIKY